MSGAQCQGVGPVLWVTRVITSADRGRCRTQAFHTVCEKLLALAEELLVGPASLLADETTAEDEPLRVQVLGDGRVEASFAEVDGGGVATFVLHEYAEGFEEAGWSWAGAEPCRPVAPDLPCDAPFQLDVTPGENLRLAFRHAGPPAMTAIVEVSVTVAANDEQVRVRGRLTTDAPAG